jgi:hypothetical protein
MTYDEIIGIVAADLGLPRKIVDRTYRAYWRAIREHIVSLPLKEDLTDEEFLKLRPNVNIPSIGKLYVTLDRYQRVKAVNHMYRKRREQKLKEKEE